MNASLHRQLNRRKRRIACRIQNQPGVERHQPMMTAANIHYELAERTRANARDSDGTVWFGDPTSPGGVATLRACHALGRPVFVVEAGTTRPSELAGWIVRQFVRTLNVAGNRESAEPGIGARVEAFLVATFRRLD